MAIGASWLAAAYAVMHHPQMLHARTRVFLAAGATLGALALLTLTGLALPAFADGGMPTPLPDPISGPDTQGLLGVLPQQAGRRGVRP